MSFAVAEQQNEICSICKAVNERGKVYCSFCGNKHNNDVNTHQGNENELSAGNLQSSPLNTKFEINRNYGSAYDKNFEKERDIKIDHDEKRKLKIADRIEELEKRDIDERFEERRKLAEKFELKQIREFEKKQELEKLTSLLGKKRELEKKRELGKRREHEKILDLESGLFRINSIKIEADSSKCF